MAEMIFRSTWIPRSAFADRRATSNTQAISRESTSGMRIIYESKLRMRDSMAMRWHTYDDLVERRQVVCSINP